VSEAREPLDPETRERYVRGRTRAPIVLAAIGLAIVGSSSAVYPSEPAFMIAGFGSAFVVCAALLGRANTRKLLAAGSAVLPLIIVSRHLFSLIGRSLYEGATFFLLGGFVAVGIARLIDPEWAQIFRAARKARQPKSLEEKIADERKKIAAERDQKAGGA
jgi:hypothetical protein